MPPTGPVLWGSAQDGWHGSHVTLATDPSSPPLARDQLSLADGTVYLNSALMSPLPLRALEAMGADARRAAEQASAAYDSRMGEVEVVRDAAATLMGVGVDDVAFVRNTTEGLGLVAAGLDWRAGDAVVVASSDHPNTVLPWRARSDAGVEVITVDPVGPAGALPLDAFASALDAGGGRVRVVAVSWVQADTGWRADLAALARRAHAHGALLCVDAIQGLGVVPCALAAWGVDAAAAGAQKWMLGPHGIGVAYVAPHLRDRLRVLAPGASSVIGAIGSELTYRTSARRFESGAHNHTGIAGLGAGLGLLADTGPDAVWAWVDHLATRLADGLGALGVEVVSARSNGERSGIVTAVLPGLDPFDAVARLERLGVVVAARGPGIRFSPHAWNTPAEVDAALTAVASL